MVSWLVPISLFWILAALYLGGAPIRIEGGGGPRQLAGLALHFVLFLVVWVVGRVLLTDIVGATFAVVVAAVLAVILLPALAKLAFRVVGVRITSVEGSGATVPEQ